MPKVTVYKHGKFGRLENNIRFSRQTFHIGLEAIPQLPKFCADNLFQIRILLLYPRHRPPTLFWR